MPGPIMAPAMSRSMTQASVFIEITWDSKAMELEPKAIDVVWNGMTITDDVKALMSVSEPYCLNGQVVVVNKDVAGQYQTGPYLSSGWLLRHQMSSVVSPLSKRQQGQRSESPCSGAPR